MGFENGFTPTSCISYLGQDCKGIFDRRYTAVFLLPEKLELFMVQYGGELA